MSSQLRLDVAQLTDVGRKRPHNEDHMAHVIPKEAPDLFRKGALFVVADGMGGHAAGEIASEIAVETVSVAYYDDASDDVGASLIHAIKRANTLIHQRAAENMLRSGMGTTCVSAVVRGSTAYIANVGDSRLYLVRGNQIKQISQDHSWVAEQVRANLLTEEQARSHAQRNVITRCLGTQSDVDVDLFIEPLEVGDTLILCSDGLSGLVDEEELGAIVNQFAPQESVYHLIERANEHGGPDNITAIVVRVLELGWEPVPVHKNGQNGHAERSSEVLAAMPTMGLPVHAISGRTSSPLALSSGPLKSDSFTPIKSHVPQRKGRLLYPSLIIALLLLVALVGSGIFYIARMNTVDVDGTLTRAQTLIDHANSEIASNNPNPALALQYLSMAQQQLHAIQGNSSLTETQSKQLTTLLSIDLVSSVKQAISSYDSQHSIITPPCLSVSPLTLSQAAPGVQSTNIMTLQDVKTGTPTFFILGDDHALYKLSGGNSLVNAQVKWPSNQTQVSAVASDGTRLLALTMLPAQANAGPAYNLSSLVLQNDNTLTVVDTVTIHSPADATGQIPTLVTAWGSDVYVALTSQTSQTTNIFHYTLDNANKLSATPEVATVSTSTAVVSMAAFPNKQLFFLFKDGSVASMQFVPANPTSTSVVMKNPIAPPLPVSATSFTSATPIPTAVTQQTPFLAVPNATLLVAGSVAGITHLYIVDSTNHRVLNLENASITQASSNSPTKTASNGGAGTAPAVTLQLDKQYVAPDQLPTINSIITAPNSTTPRVYVLTKESTNTTILSLEPGQNGVCTS